MTQDPTISSKQDQITLLQSKIASLKQENASLRQFTDNIQKSIESVKAAQNGDKANTSSNNASNAAGKILPKKGQKNVLITSALPYVNNVPHLGNIIGAVLSADVYARYLRQRGVNTLYICGTDEYGTATETKALQEGITPQEICDKYHKIHASIYEWFDIKFDHFGRTSTQKQTEIAQHIFKKIQENNLLSEHESEQFFCDTCERFLADRFVHGTCPHCGYEDARGDQCDECGKLLEEPSQLINPKCSICNTEPRLKKSSHLYLKLPEIQPELTQWFEKSSGEGRWTNVATSITKSWLKEGLLDRCITRDLKWGTPVPDERFKDKVFYVWFDAPIGYISITANYTDEWKQWWQNPEDVELVQFMGKDNVPFHSVIFPSSLLATKENWTMVNSLSSTSYLNYEDTAFSKSRGTGVFGDHAKETGIPAFAWRYYLLAVRPVASDSAFEWGDFANKVNNELIANFGNFANRALKFIGTNFDNKLPAVSELLERDHRLIQEVNPLVKEYIESLDQVRLKEALYTAMAISKLGNQYLQDEKPWVLVKEDLSRCATVVNVASHLVLLLSALMEPFVPELSERLLQQLNFKPQGENRIPDEFTLGALPVGHVLGSVEPLVNKILPKQVEEFKAKYSGKREDQAEPFPLDLRVGEVKEVTDHPGADLLYLLKVDIGRGENVQIAGGLKTAYPEKTDLVGKKVIVVANLKAANFKGEMSEGMLLAAKKKDSMELLDPTDGGKNTDVKVGTVVAPDNAPLKPAKEATRKILQAALKEMKTGANGRAEFFKLPLVVQGTKTFAQAPTLGKGAKIA